MAELTTPEPMEARLANALPDGEMWQFEPKWDGFRCLARRSGARIDLVSKSGKPLGRYFPELVDMFGSLSDGEFILDGEIILALADALSFEALQMRLHPAQSRVRKLSAETPAHFMLFDQIALNGTTMADRPLAERRAELEKFFQRNRTEGLLLSPATSRRDVALGWLERSGGALDGVVAKRIDQPYLPGERAMLKIKQHRTADCVVGGFRYASKAKEVGSLLLGLYDNEGLLHHVGFTSAIPLEGRRELTADLEQREEPPGFTGAAPGGPSRWANARSAQWQPLRPDLVVEVRYDQVTGRRFRHGTALLRWRPDKDPRQCTFDQIAPALTGAQVAELSR